VGSGSSPNGVEITSVLERPLACEKTTEREAASTACPGSLVVIGCLDGLRRHQAMGSSSKKTSGELVTAVVGSDDMGFSRSVSEGTQGVTRGVLKWVKPVSGGSR
jgi:hypothetical protein